MRFHGGILYRFRCSHLAEVDGRPHSQALKQSHVPEHMKIPAKYSISLNNMVGLARFELTTSCTPCKRSTRLNYSPTYV